MAGFILASRRNDGQETNKKLFGKSYDLQMKTLLKASKLNYDLQKKLLEASKLKNRASTSKSNSNVKRAVRNLHRLNANASVDPQDTDKWTPLMFSAKRGSKHDIDCLVNAGADVNAINNKNETSIIIAVINHKRNAVKALLRHNADITRADCDEKTAVAHAQKTFTIAELKQLGPSILQAHRGIEDQLCTRFAHDQMTGLNDHIRKYHCGNGEEVFASGVARRWPNNGDCKTLFPERWLEPPQWIEKKTVKAIKSVLHSPKKLYRGNPKKLVVKGKFKYVPTLVAEGKFKDVSKEGNFDVSIRVIIAKNGSESNVVTAYPLIDQEEEKAYSYALEAGKGE